MKEPVIVDTNVPIFANSFQHPDPSECQISCREALVEIRRSKVVLLDSLGHILMEYLAQSPWRDPQGEGDLFIIWVKDNEWNSNYCKLIEIHQSYDDRTYLEFPDATDLVGFDLDDKKFVAVAVASGDNPPILNASDSDWIKYREALENHNVKVIELCPT